MIQPHRTPARSDPVARRFRPRAAFVRPALAALAALAGTAGAAPPGAALGQWPGFYAGQHTGASDLNNGPATVSLGAGTRSQLGLGLEAGARGGLAVGRRTDNARFEFEYQRGRFQLRGTDLGAISEAAGGSGRYETFLFNADRVLPVSGALAAYVGGGIGWGALSFPRVGSAGGCNCLGTAFGNGLAYQGRIGFEYTFANGPNVFVQAGWISLPGASSTDAAGVDYPRRGTATLDAGLRLRF